MQFIFAIIIFFTCSIAHAENKRIILQCDQIGAPLNKSSIEIDLAEKWIKLDSAIDRLNRESLNKAQLPKYQEALKVGDQIGILFWAPKQYSPSKFSVESITSDEVVAYPSFPVKGSFVINRNTLLVTQRESIGGMLNESSYSCKRVSSGF